MQNWQVWWVAGQLMKQLLELGSKSYLGKDDKTDDMRIDTVLFPTQRPFVHSQFQLNFCSVSRLGFPSTVAKQAANQCSSAGSPRAELLKLCMLCHIKCCQSLVVCCIFIFTDAFGFAHQNFHVFLSEFVRGHFHHLHDPIANFFLHVFAGWKRSVLAGWKWEVVLVA